MTRKDVLTDVLVNLIAAVSLLKAGGKKAAPSERMFDQMIADYEGAIDRGRAALKDGEPNPITPGDEHDQSHHTPGSHRIRRRS